MATPLTDPSLQDLIRQQQPAEFSAGCFFALPGTSGSAVKVVLPSATLVARRQPARPLPFTDRQREYRILKKLARGGLVPSPVACHREWLLQPWQPGDALTGDTFSQHCQQITAALATLHHQPLTGYRLSLTALLEQYWQQCRHRTHHWLRHWQQLRRRGEPAPLRLAPVHMDIHAGNVIREGDDCYFIDWEYAADGDIALDLTVICLNDPAHAALWIDSYARRTGISSRRLTAQVARWRPWLKLLVACWYQLRSEQTDDPQLTMLASQCWQNL